MITVKLKDRFRKKWVVRPTKKMLRNMGYNIPLDENVGIYDNVVSALIKDDVYYAQVSMDYEPRLVTITQTSKQTLDVNCGCPQMSYGYRGGWVCEHVSAAFQYLSDNFAELVHESYSRESKIKYTLETIDGSDAKDFLYELFDMDILAYGEFLKRFETVAEEVETDYNMDIERLYYEAMDSAGKVGENLNFAPFFNMASNSKGAVQAGVYRSMSEVIYRNMGVVDDKDGYYSDCFVESIENMIESVLQISDKKVYLEYFAAMMIKAPADFSRHYRTALEAVCASEEDLEYLQGLLPPLLKKASKPEQKAELTRLQVYMLEETDQTDEAIKLLEGTYRLSPALRAKYIDCLREVDRDAAKSAAASIIKEFPDDEVSMKAALGMYGPADPEYVKLAAGMFGTTGDWKYYTMMKGSDLCNIPDLIKSLLKNEDARKAIDVCLKEKMYDDAMDILESNRRLDLMGQHAKQLGKMYPARYFDAYAPMMEQLATSKTGKPRKLQRFVTIFHESSAKAPDTSDTNKKHCERIRNHLLIIKGLGDDRYEKLVSFVRSKNRDNEYLQNMLHDL